MARLRRSRVPHGPLIGPPGGATFHHLAWLGHAAEMYFFTCVCSWPLDRKPGSCNHVVVAAEFADGAGTLDFHDALIALACQERGIHVIASFDGDFDQVMWLRRPASLEDVTAALA